LFKLPGACFAAACAALVMAPAQASAQTQTMTGAEASRFRLGALGLTPTFNLSNVGVDTNVFNSAADPERDFTATLAPGVKSALRVGRVYVSGRTEGEWVYFTKATKQRSVNFNQDLDVSVPLSYVTPRLGGSYGTTRQRLNAELDVRARRKTKTAFIGSAVRFSARTTLDVEARITTFDMADDQFLGINLQQQLDRRETSGRVSLDYMLTPLTTWRVTAERLFDRFTFSHLRDSDSTRVTTGVTMKPLALFSGDAMVGVRVFSPRESAVEPFTGLVSAIEMTYHMRETTRMAFKANRDVDSSFLPDTPYFLQGTLSVGLTQVVGAAWDVGAGVDRTALRYRGLRNGSAVLPGTDRSWRYHSGVGYHLSDGTRIGFDLDYVRRDSSSFGRDFDGFRAGGSFAYGL
jgi:hypothetical protein